MKKTRHTPNQITTKLRKVEAARAEGRTVADAVRDSGVTEQTDYRWKREYGSPNHPSRYTMQNQTSLSLPRRYY